jgi:hypothetical protein
MSSESTILRLFGQAARRERIKWRLHPLIHTFGFWGLGTKCWGKNM